MTEKTIPLLIINNKTNKLMKEKSIHQGQTYKIPKGYEIIHKEFNKHVEKVWISKQ